jgi:hypothetical protein
VSWVVFPNDSEKFETNKIGERSEKGRERKDSGEEVR